MNRSLLSGFLESVERFPERPALEVGGAQFTYSKLNGMARSMAEALLCNRNEKGSPLTAVFAYRSENAFAGVLAALLGGRGYVPLNRNYPMERTLAMLNLSDSREIIIGGESPETITSLLNGAENSMHVLLTDLADATELRERHPRHRFTSAKHLIGKRHSGCINTEHGEIAYLLFTSGSTGVPKGVVISHENVLHFLKHVADRYGITEEDRLSQTFDMTFDLSVFDLFLAWERGACVCCPPKKALLNPSRYILESNLTIWFSVPSVAAFMLRLGSLKPGKYPRLRHSLFCGEALPVEIASAWAKAAPNSVVENLYGPTELTIACTSYRWNGDESLVESEAGAVPIGEPFPAMEVKIVDDDLREVLPGECGELLMSGPQRSPGYWQDSERTGESFITMDHGGELFYRTGDRVRRPVPGKPITYLGRIDNQIKIQGHRVELGEIEAALRRKTGRSEIVALGWPVTVGGAGGVVAFIAGAELSEEAIRTELARQLPQYMVPRKLHFLNALPINSNGKIDRNALLDILREKNA